MIVCEPGCDIFILPQTIIPNLQARKFILHDIFKKLKNKLAMAAEIITQIDQTFDPTRIIVTTDSWFGNDGLWKPSKDQLGIWVDRLESIFSSKRNNRLTIITHCIILSTITHRVTREWSGAAQPTINDSKR